MRDKFIHIQKIYSRYLFNFFERQVYTHPQTYPILHLLWGMKDKFIDILKLIQNNFWTIASSSFVCLFLMLCKNGTLALKFPYPYPFLIKSDIIKQCKEAKSYFSQIFSKFDSIWERGCVFKVWWWYWQYGIFGEYFV